MIQNKTTSMQRKHHKRRMVWTSILCGIALMGTGIGIGWAIHTSKKTNPDFTNPQILLKRTEGDPSLKNEGDYIEYNVECNISLSNFTGSNVSISDIEQIGQNGQGFIWLRGYTPDTHEVPIEKQTRIIWNNPDDISKGVRLHIELIKDYDGSLGEFLPIDVTFTIHDDKNRYEDVKTTAHVVLDSDNDEPVITNDRISNVSTINMGMNRDTTIEDIVNYLQATNESISGTQTLNDDFFSQNINPSQVAALFFIETLNIWKNCLVDFFNTYVDTEQEYAMDTSFYDFSQYTIDFRIDDIIYSGSDTFGNKKFFCSFEQEIFNNNNETINCSDRAHPAYFVPKYPFPKDNSDNIFPFYDIPSAYYYGINKTISDVVSSYTTSTERCVTNLSGGSNFSASLIDSNEYISGNLINLWVYPYRTGGISLFNQTDYTPTSIAELFWPNVTFAN